MQPTILIAEDSATQAMALRAVLEERGYLVHHEPSGEAALAYLDGHEVDLVLSDIVMPGMSGYELCRRIKADSRLCHLPIVLLTSLSDPMDIVRGLECGADNYVTKPYDPDYLHARLRHVLDRQQLRRSPRASVGVSVSFLGTSFSITSDKEQILDLFISSVEEVVRANAALQESQREVLEAQTRLEEYARAMARQAELSAEKYATLMHQASDAILVLDEEGHVLEANVRATELFGRPLDELRGRRLDALATARGARSIRQRLADLRRTPRITVSAVDFVHQSGRVVTCDFSASRTSSRDGDLVLAILHDVTALREAAERLRKSEALLAQTQQIAAIGSWERDLETNTAAWSEEMYRLLGAAPGEIPASLDTLLARVHPGDRATLRDGVAQSIRTGHPLDVEVRLTPPAGGGGPRMLAVRGGVVLGEDGTPAKLLGTMQDVTERRQLEHQFLQAQKMEAVGQLAGGIAHDFNNLLTVITSYTSMVLSDLEPDDDKRADLLEIKGAADRAAGLTRQLLAFSRRQMLQPRLVDLNGLTANLATLLRRLVPESIGIATVLDPGAGLVEADPGQVEQVLVNLAVNARDAMPAGGTLTIQTASVVLDDASARRPEHAAIPPGRYAILTVTDSGSGMPPEVRERIFEPFFTTKGPDKGTGLGLSTVYGIVRQSGGQITVQSEPGRGTTFTIFLPQVGDDPPAPTSLASAPSVSTASEAGNADDAAETVLIVEDDSALRAVASRVLRKHGYRVLQARDGAEALEICQALESPLHLVVTDMVMPGMSGDELARRIAEYWPGIRVLLMSGYTRDAIARDRLAREGSAFLEKPFMPDELVARVREVLEWRPER